MLQNRVICLVGRVIANSLGELGSFTCCIISKTLKIVVDTSLLKTQQYKLHIMGQWSNPEKGVAPNSSHQCCSY